MLQLKKNEEIRIKNGHLWVYSNEINTDVTPLKNIIPGQLVHLHDYKGQFIGHGYANPKTLLCARILTRDPEQMIDDAFLENRIANALAMRESYFPEPFYRLIYGEGDFLPGLIVDRFGDTLSVQLTTAGTELLKDQIINALIKVIAPKTIVLRNDHSMRATEGLESYTETVYGTLDDTCEIIENGTRFVIPVGQGQKTGWFFDHGANRQRMIPFVKNKRVLDVFSYLGAWSIQALKHGASEAWALDSSAPALDICEENAKLNGVGDKLHRVQGDAFQQLKALFQQGEFFDVVLLDPPAFIKRRKDKKEGLLAYQRINELALKVLKKEGVFITSSCSLHLEATELLNAVSRANQHQQRSTRIIGRGHQNIDHPIHPMIPETDYLKTLFCKMI
jgi:23S rRNA (cytosine1962-C5)-methyltransferase